MKILVIGAGVIGSIYGWVLSQGNHEVTHLIRDGKKDKLHDGIPIDILDGRKGYTKKFTGKYNVSIANEKELAQEYDFIIIPTKPYQVNDVIKKLEEKHKQNYFILTQNWGGTAELDNLIDRKRYVYGDAKAGGTFVGDALIGSIFPVIDVGQVDNEQTELLKKVVSVFDGSRIKVNIHENILEYIWVQYAINAGLWPALVEQGSFTRLLHDKKAGYKGLAAVQECLDVLKKMGVDLSKYSDTKIYESKSKIVRYFVWNMMKVIFTYNKSVIRSSAHALSDMKEIANSYNDLMKKGFELQLPMNTMKTYGEYFKNYV